MTAFEITLICVILYVLDWVFILKHWDKDDAKPNNFTEWTWAFILTLCLSAIELLIGYLIYLAYLVLSQVDWHSYFTQKIL